MSANLASWIRQVLLALAFLAVGFGHSVGFERSVQRRGMGWLATARCR
jgi:hypothetical protein